MRFAPCTWGLWFVLSVAKTATRDVPRPGPWRAKPKIQLTINQLLINKFPHNFLPKFYPTTNWLCT